MDLKRQSYQFHKQIESPSAFVRREWRAVAICAGGFCLAMLAGVMLVDPAFFYPRIQNDPLNYILKAKALVETGSTTAHWAVNVKPFAYVSMPGVIRAPILFAFSEFDDRLTGMQVLNIPIVAGVALMSAYILSWAVPKDRHWMAIAFAFGFTVLSPLWIYNVILPLADAPYAACTLGAILAARELLCSDKPLLHRPGLVTAFAALFVVAFLLRFIAVVVLLFAAVLAMARWRELGLSRRYKWAAAIFVALFLVVLIGFNVEPIFGRYFREPFSFLKRGDKPGMLISLLGSALPSQVIPSFTLGFDVPPLFATFYTAYSASLLNILWTTLGFLISLIMLTGMWRSRNRFLPEVVYVLAALPIFAMMLPSTIRYLMPYQPFFWIFFYVGLAAIASRVPSRFTQFFRSRLLRTAALALVIGSVAGLRSWKVAGSASERYLAVSLAGIPGYVSDVSATFRSLRNYLETLPEDRTLLIGSPGTSGRWSAISDRNYYRPDGALGRQVRTKDVYVLLECGTTEPCQKWDSFKRDAQRRILVFGNFRFESVFAAQSRRSRVEVLRLRPSA